MELMDKHTNHLEELVYDRTRQLHEEKQRDEIEFKLKFLSGFFFFFFKKIHLIFFFSILSIKC